MNREENVAEIVNAMSGEYFHKTIIRGVCKMPEFGHLVSAGAHDLSTVEKQSVQKALSAAGISDTVLSTEGNLDKLAWAIARRSVSVK